MRGQKAGALLRVQAGEGGSEEERQDQARWIKGAGWIPVEFCQSEGVVSGAPITGLPKVQCGEKRE